MIDKYIIKTDDAVVYPSTNSAHGSLLANFSLGCNLAFLFPCFEEYAFNVVY
jgi:hypothetical protein